MRSGTLIGAHGAVCHDGRGLRDASEALVPPDRTGRGATDSAFPTEKNAPPD
jgi:hypothetical protein